MDLQKIKQLIDAMAASDLTELELVEATWTLRLSRAAKPQSARTSGPSPGARSKSFEPQQVTLVEPDRSSTVDVHAPLSGVVYLQPAPDKPPFVSIGQAITAGTPICVIEAMKVFNEVRAEADGVVEAIMVTSGGEIDAGQPVLRLLRKAA
jgi:acetyl-CoA carboxylase biotin carboxyl carrier protein